MSKPRKPTKAERTAKNKKEQAKPEALPGWPGYRTRQGRSGLDPVDSRTEAAHTFGALIRQLVTGNLLVENPVILFLMGLFGLALTTPLLLALSSLPKGNSTPWEAWGLLALVGLVGLALLVNCGKSLVYKLR